MNSKQLFVTRLRKSGKTVLFISLFLSLKESSTSQSLQVLKVINEGSFLKVNINGVEGYFTDSIRFNIATFKIMQYEKMKPLLKVYQEKVKADSVEKNVIKGVVIRKQEEIQKKDSTITRKDEKIEQLTKTNKALKKVSFWSTLGLAVSIYLYLK